MEYFADVPKIEYEGPQSKNSLAFKHYNPEEILEGQSMQDLFRFSICYWHTFRGAGVDPFGAGTMIRPWEDGTDSVENACNRAANTRADDKPGKLCNQPWQPVSVAWKAGRGNGDRNLSGICRCGTDI